MRTCICVRTRADTIASDEFNHNSKANNAKVKLGLCLGVLCVCEFHRPATFQEFLRRAQSCLPRLRTLPGFGPAPVRECAHDSESEGSEKDTERKREREREKRARGHSPFTRALSNTHSRTHALTHSRTPTHTHNLGMGFQDGCASPPTLLLGQLEGGHTVSSDARVGAELE